ncbi:hypothetical protein BKA66DRAFT_476384 [Pyrenochaeta sp. MPI-SDFR-AT-0127]|nr:hypothetical protein BKA66DRAFT_476384 [Pyrenochaeta sp. MPI-SDFR-AT-0127]
MCLLLFVNYALRPSSSCNPTPATRAIRQHLDGLHDRNLLLHLASYRGPCQCDWHRASCLREGCGLNQNNFLWPMCSTILSSWIWTPLHPERAQSARDDWAVASLNQAYANSKEGVAGAPLQVSQC